jgi:hypothetical protein
MGGFRSQFGRTGKDFGGGEEVVAACLARQLGYTVAVCPKSKVRHAVDPSRFSFEHVRKTIRSGILVNYQIQTSLYLPRETTIRTSWWQTKQWLASWVNRRRESGSIGDPLSREAFYYVGANIKLMWIQIVDFFARLRTPINQRDA